MCRDEKAIVRGRLQQIEESIGYISQWCSRISCSDDFLLSMDAVMVFNATVMRLQVIGEQVGKLLVMSPSPLDGHGEIPWRAIYGLRNIISHEYNNIDEQVIYSVVKDDLPALSRAVADIRRAYEPPAQE